MESTFMHDISLAQFKKLFPQSPSVGLGDDFYIIDVQMTERNSPLSHPCRFDGFMIVYCIGGHIKLNINLEEYELNENMLFLYMPGNVIRVNEFVDSRQEDMHYRCIAMSRKFVSELMLDVNKIFTKNLALIQNPCVTLRTDEKKLLCSHLNLITEVLGSRYSYRADSIRSVLSSVFYFLAGLWASRLEKTPLVNGRVSARSRVVFEQFIKLVSEHHRTYRNVGFYADKLCLTPKYLSKVIKEATGQSAPDWIDSYVILEAKSLLKYSGKAIKEIVYQLHFPNQSVFYKFFKARTGMTPTEYRNS